MESKTSERPQSFTFFNDIHKLINEIEKSLNTINIILGNTNDINVKKILKEKKQLYQGTLNILRELENIEEENNDELIRLIIEFKKKYNELKIKENDVLFEKKLNELRYEETITEDNLRELKKEIKRYLGVINNILDDVNDDDINVKLILEEKKDLFEKTLNKLRNTNNGSDEINELINNLLIIY